MGQGRTDPHGLPDNWDTITRISKTNKLQFMVCIGIYNIKGGVGKTTTAVNLSHLASLDGLKTLIWDLDPQGSSTFYLNKKQGLETDLKKMLSGKFELGNYIKKTGYPNLHLIPANFSFRHLDIALEDVKKSKKRINELLKTLKKDFDVVFLDCPPGISLLSENIFFASDHLLVPIIPTPLSIRTFKQILTFYTGNDLDIASVVPFFSMVDSRKKIHKDSIDEMTHLLPQVFKSMIPYLSEIEKIGVFQKPISVYSPKSKASEAFVSLWSEIKERFIN
jgi:cellulose biosynthesis protein BcsQ